MAMTKAEKETMRRMRVRAALNWPAPVEPMNIAVTMEATGKKYIEAWTINAYSKNVSKGWTDGHRHSREGPAPQEGNRHYSASQTGGGPWFATRFDALCAMHRAVAERYASNLADVEEMIEREMADRVSA